MAHDVPHSARKVAFDEGQWGLVGGVDCTTHVNATGPNAKVVGKEVAVFFVQFFATKEHILVHIFAIDGEVVGATLIDLLVNREKGRPLAIYNVVLAVRVVVDRSLLYFGPQSPSVCKEFSACLLRDGQGLEPIHAGCRLTA